MSSYQSCASRVLPSLCPHSEASSLLISAKLIHKPWYLMFIKFAFLSSGERLEGLFLSFKFSAVLIAILGLRAVEQCGKEEPRLTHQGGARTSRTGHES